MNLQKLEIIQTVITRKMGKQRCYIHKKEKQNKTFNKKNGLQTQNTLDKSTKWIYGAKQKKLTKMDTSHMDIFMWKSRQKENHLISNRARNINWKI